MSTFNKSKLYQHVGRALAVEAAVRHDVITKHGTIGVVHSPAVRAYYDQLLGFAKAPANTFGAMLRVKGVAL